MCDGVCGGQVAALANSLSSVLGQSSGGSFVREAVLHPWGRPATEEFDDPSDAGGAGAPVPEALQGSSEQATPRFVSGMQDGSLMLWRAADGARERTWEGHGWGHAVRALAAAPGCVISGSTDGTLRLWKLADASCAGVLRGHEDTVRAVLALPGGRVLSGADDATVRLWSLASGECQAVLRGHSGAVWALCLLADGSGRAVSGAWDGDLRVWALPPPGEAPGTDELMAERALSGHKKAVHALAALPGGARVVSGSADQTLRVWDAAAGVCERTLDVGRAGVVHALVALGEARVAAGCGDGALRVWHCGAPGTAARCERVLKGHADGAFALALLPDGRVVSGSSDKSLCVWAACERERVLVPPVAAGATWAIGSLGAPPTRARPEWDGPPVGASPRKEAQGGARSGDAPASGELASAPEAPLAEAPPLADEEE
jgi:WD40 repeat protein